MSRDTPVRSWPASYYVSREKRWVSGTLSLSRTSVSFASEPSRGVAATVPLSHVVEVKMESSSFIFGALTVLEQGGVKHWFGSLRPCRAAVYHVVEHFWRERLLGPGEAQVPPAPLSKGQELISLVSGAQRRLADTGKVINHQGEQFDNVMQGLDKIESDLGVADKLLSELESPPWWPFGKLPWRSQPEKAEAAAKAPCPKGSGKAHKVISSIPVVVSRGGNPGEVKPGSLTVLVSGLEVRGAGGQLVHRFERDEVDDIRVHSPYELSVRQRFIGKPDVCYRLLSAKMGEALAVLEVQYKKKVEFMSDYAAFQATPTNTPGSADSAAAFWAAGVAPVQGLDTEMPAGMLTQVQLHVLRPTVTEAEAQELKQMLTQLKSLALEAETELERQDETLDALASSSDRATMTIDKHTRRMRKLL
ncbi:synaptosomal-associated protein 47 [Electrophorus electricus]|uniref:Synaptosomal-associated protein 47 n=1 Tax=Electrophorus electricus TaxID=8005 RepID=A0A4W4GQP2_ELEEL|nr:synaptosomal-associated protein 47 [Electrophorus electricus]XP_026886905.2 synaptosomal-associated protein 47 [Electrophorus electricus]